MSDYDIGYKGLTQCVFLVSDFDQCLLGACRGGSYDVIDMISDRKGLKFSEDTISKIVRDAQASIVSYLLSETSINFCMLKAEVAKQRRADVAVICKSPSFEQFLSDAVFDADWEMITSMLEHGAAHYGRSCCPYSWSGVLKLAVKFERVEIINKMVAKSDAWRCKALKLASEQNRHFVTELVSKL